MEELKMPELSISIEVGGEYLEIKLPTVGEFIEIERRKIMLSGGTHGDMISGGTFSSLSAYQNVEMIATLEVVIKDLNKRLKVKTLNDLRPHEAILLSKEYNTKVFPWLKDWREFINQSTKTEDEEVAKITKSKEEVETDD